MGLGSATRILAIALAPVLLFTGVAVHAAEYYQGLAYAKGSERLLYREEHWLYPGGGDRLVLYRCASGEPFARKRVTGEGTAPDFDFTDARTGYAEGVRTTEGRREVFTREASGAPERRKAIDPGEVQIIDAGFDSFVRQQWDALAPPGEARVSFLVPSRLQPMAFRLRPSDGPSGTRSYRLSVDAWYGRALPGIAVTYADRGKRLLAFEGIGNIRDEAGRYPPVRIEFPSNLRRKSTAAERMLAATQSLARSCRGS